MTTKQVLKLLLAIVLLVAGISFVGLLFEYAGPVPLSIFKINPDHYGSASYSRSAGAAGAGLVAGILFYGFAQVLLDLIKSVPDKKE